MVPEHLIRTIVEVYAPRRVLLFGSQARGDAGPDSDLDLVVVLDDDAPAEALSWRRRDAAPNLGQRKVEMIPSCPRRRASMPVYQPQKWHTLFDEAAKEHHDQMDTRFRGYDGQISELEIWIRGSSLGVRDR